MFAFVRLHLVYDNWLEDTPPMQRWLAEVFVDAIAGGWCWTPGCIVRRLLIVAA